MDLWRIYLPYCLEQIADNRWIILNRKYLPLGRDSTEIINYQDDQSVFSFSSKPDKILAANMIIQSIKNENTKYFFYDDNTCPYSSIENTRKYFSRVEKIMKLNSK